MKKSWCKQWLWGPGYNKELTLYLWADFTAWSLPIHIDWRYNVDAVKNKFLYIDIKFLCFGFGIEKWKFIIGGER